MTPTKFRTARKASGLTQKQLAKVLKMGAHGWQTISKWERDSFDGVILGPIGVLMELIATDALPRKFYHEAGVEPKL